MCWLCQIEQKILRIRRGKEADKQALFTKDACKSNKILSIGSMGSNPLPTNHKPLEDDEIETELDHVLGILDSAERSTGVHHHENDLLARRMEPAPIAYNRQQLPQHQINFPSNRPQLPQNQINYPLLQQQQPLNTLMTVSYTHLTLPTTPYV